MHDRNFCFLFVSVCFSSLLAVFPLFHLVDLRLFSSLTCHQIPGLAGPATLQDDHVFLKRMLPRWLLLPSVVSSSPAAPSDMSLGAADEAELWGRAMRQAKGRSMPDLA